MKDISRIMIAALTIGSVALSGCRSARPPASGSGPSNETAEAAPGKVSQVGSTTGQSGGPGTTYPGGTGVETGQTYPAGTTNQQPVPSGAEPFAPPSCRQDVVVAMTSDSTPQETSGFQVTSLYDEKALRVDQRRSSEACRDCGLEEIFDRMARTVVLEKVCADDARSCVVTNGDADLLEEKYGYAEGSVTPDCRFAAMVPAAGPTASGGRPVPGGVRASASWPEGWQARMTGAEAVVQRISRSLKNPPRVRVAVLDSGIDDRVVPLAASWTPSSSTACAPGSQANRDPFGHGTSVASLAYDYSGRLADILSIKVLDDGGIGTQACLAQGIYEASRLNAQLINLSLAYAQHGVDPMPWFVRDAFQLAYAKGIRTYAAAGNLSHDGHNMIETYFPAALEDLELGITSVGGMNANMEPSIQSVWPAVDVWAPSEFICTRTSLDGNGKAREWRLSGTSFAVPQVVGGLALAMASRGLDANLAVSDPAGYASRLGALQGKLEEFRVPVTSLAAPSVPALNLCTMLGESVKASQRCRAWRAALDPVKDGTCDNQAAPAPAATTYKYSSCSPVTGNGDYPASTWCTPPNRSSSPLPLDQQGEAAWYTVVSSAPGTHVCVGCDYCSKSSGSGTITLNLTLRETSPRLEQYQLKIKAADGSLYYYPLNLTTFGGVQSYEMTIDPVDILAVWVIALDRATGQWTSDLLAKAC